MKMKSLLLLAVGAGIVFVIAVLAIVYRFMRIIPTVPARSPLAQAVFDGATDRVKTLLDQGVDPNTAVGIAAQIKPEGEMSTEFKVAWSGKVESEAGMSVLSFAAIQGSIDIVRMLMERGADVNSKDKYGQTPLILAAWQGDEKSVRLFLSKGADITARDHAGKTALMWAKLEGHDAVVRLLEKAGASD